MRAPIFAAQCDANRLIDVLRGCVAQGQFELNDFVVMPDHVHLLITLRGGITVERAMRIVKREVSNRLREDTGFQGEIWEPGFSEKRAASGEDYQRFRNYIAQNPVKAGLCGCDEEFPHNLTSCIRKVRGER